MKKVLLFIFALISINLFSQIQVKENSFRKIDGFVMLDKHYDDNDNPMALIKISTENISLEQRAKFYFKGNLETYFDKHLQEDGQLYLYISAVAPFVEIIHPDYGKTEYHFPFDLCDFCGYEMVVQYVPLVSESEYGFLAISSEPSAADIYIDGKYYGKTNNVITDIVAGNHELKLEKEGYVTVTKTIVVTKGETLKVNETLQTVSSQKAHLIVRADQENAMIYIDDELLGVKEASRIFKFGTTHTWMIKCNMYHTESGSVTLNERTVIDKKLRPNYGFLNISTTPEQGAMVFVDEEYVGLSPVKTDKLKSGSHSVKVMKDMYKMTEKSFYVNDKQTTNVTLNMSANSVDVTVSDTDAGYKGNEKLTDRPINGEIEINSSPMGATIYIDGEYYGETPNYISGILIGEHELKLTKQGCAELKKTIKIKGGETLTINEKLPIGKEISISTDQSGDKIYVDGNYLGISPIATYLPYGNYEVKAERSGKTVSKTINVAQSGGDDSVKLTFFANQTITVNGISFTMIAVEGGTFLMGAVRELDSDADSDESPVHNVTLSDYYIGETEVTQDLWETVMKDRPSCFFGNKRPVERVSWNDCQEFITRLNQLTGMNFRLPTEAEWEYAARGGNKSQGYKYSGSNTIGDVAWYDGNSSSQTHEVKTKQANELGIYDMSGNVWEWCQDWYRNYNGSSQTNPTGPSSGSYCVHRGGGWNFNAGYCRVSNRRDDNPGCRVYFLGLRLSLSQD